MVNFYKFDKTKLKRFGGLAAILILVSGLSGAGGAWLQDRYAQNGLGSGNLSGQKKIVGSSGQLISQIAQSVGPSVVSVNVAMESDIDPFNPFGFPAPQESRGSGTGIIISADGLIMTNRHVVPAGTSRVSVTLSDGTELKNVSVIGRTNPSDSLDVAFLKVNDTKGRKLVPAALGDSSKVQVGDNVVAIGNALGQFQNTVTGGIISGYGRDLKAGDSSSGSFENLLDLFQTDAAINAGNSGGPLVNLNGQVIGITTAVAGDAQNIGFAIPINNVRGLIAQVIKTGKFVRPYLGVRYVPLTADIASQLGLDNLTNGAFIVPSSDPVNNPSVVGDSPADRAGLRERDVITQVDGRKIDQGHSLTSLLGDYRPGNKITLTVLRGGKTLHIAVTLGTMPSQ